MANPRPPGSRTRILAFLIDHVGEIVNKDQIRKASGDASEWARRLRELRDEQGYLIRSHTDRADLRPGEYILESAEPGSYAFAREISAKLRAEVLTRNGRTCQMCGVEAGAPHPDNNGRKATLHLGHIVDVTMGGKNEASNLRALCSVCNQGASNVTQAPPEYIKLLTHVRRAGRKEQIMLLNWLAEKFGADVSVAVE